MIELLWTWTCSRCGIEAMGDNVTMERAAARHVKQTGHSVILSGRPTPA